MTLLIPVNVSQHSALIGQVLAKAFRSKTNQSALDVQTAWLSSKHDIKWHFTETLIAFWKTTLTFNSLQQSFCWQGWFDRGSAWFRGPPSTRDADAPLEKTWYIYTALLCKNTETFVMCCLKKKTEIAQPWSQMDNDKGKGFQVERQWARRSSVCFYFRKPMRTQANNSRAQGCP